MLWEWRAYFTKEAIEEGIDVKISTWARNAPNTMPAMAKSVANYANAAADQDGGDADGYAEGIALDTQRQPERRQRPEPVHRPRRRHLHAADRQLGAVGHHPRLGDDASPRTSGFEVREQTLPREMLYIADEVFFVRHGGRGHADPLGRPHQGRPRPPRADHRGIQQRFFQIVQGRSAGHARLAAARRHARRCRATSGARARADNQGVDARQRPAEDRRRERRLGPAPQGRQLPDDAGPRAPRRRPREDKRLDHEDMVAIAGAVLPTGQREKFKDTTKSTSPTASPASAASAATPSSSAARSAWSSASSRCEVATIDELALPPVLKKIAAEERGLVLVTGTTGSGKSTTLAAMIDEINAHAHRAHHDDRRPDRVPAPRQPVDHQPARDRRRHRVVRARAAQRAAPGPRRHPGRRDARLRDDRDGAARRRDRPPGVLDAAHARRHRDDQPHHRGVPAAPAEADPPAAGQRAEGGRSRSA